MHSNLMKEDTPSQNDGQVISNVKKCLFQDISDTVKNIGLLLPFPRMRFLFTTFIMN